VSGKRVTEFEKRDAVASKGMIQGEVAMAQSSPQRSRYLAARRRGLTQTQARTEAGVSRSSAWRYVRRSIPGVLSARSSSSPGQLIVGSGGES
jgi:hypothetical protein